MFDQLTGDDLYAEILLLLDQGKAVVVVEGPDDLDALDSHIDDGACYAIPGYGKTSVIDAIRLADADDARQVIAILDRDWTGILDDPIDSENVVYTDWYDLDATILRVGDNYLRVAASFCDPVSMKRHIARSVLDNALDFAVRPAVAVGAIRLVAREQSMNLRARDFPMGEIVDLDGGQPDLRKTAVIAVASASNARPKEHLDVVADVLATTYSRIEMNYRYCSGHDLLSALSVVMRKRWRSSASAGTVAKAVRAAFSCVELMQTTFFAEVKAWGESRSVNVWNCRGILAPTPGIVSVPAPRVRTTAPLGQATSS
ncbi:toprim domain-containing protein [Phytohabitans suffuscus]|uniref:DUF4435 domain-containing protein n=1 Tax=Phytohabitans suffuscus TaxID=624315 RepID=A0A6F8YMW3_9ACTN|nr:hypothetical protein [Phytohabitans suffuscus]BCB87434.1 hypothetical protein Psuf_047470 [Phytohabitans suffuscus]